MDWWSWLGAPRQHPQQGVVAQAPPLPVAEVIPVTVRSAEAAPTPARPAATTTIVLTRFSSLWPSMVAPGARQRVDMDQA
jgi:hypothetical protein